MRNTGTIRAEMEQVARRWMQAWQGGGADALIETHAVHFRDHSQAGRPTDTKGFAAGLQALYHAFPDLYAEIDELAIDIEAQLVTVRWSATGTQAAPFMGYPPSNRRIAFKGMELLRVIDGRITERWGEWDAMDLLAQLRA